MSRNRSNLRHHLLAILWLPVCATCPAAQMPGPNASLPDAPQMRLIAQASQSNAPVQPDAADSTPARPPGVLPLLSRTQAEQMATRNNPRISVARLLALAQHQVVRESQPRSCPPSRVTSRLWTPKMARASPLEPSPPRLFRTRRRRWQWQPVDHRFWKNQKSGCFLEAPGRSSERQHPGHHRGHRRRYRPGILRRIASPGPAACGPTECLHKADHTNPG